MMTNTFYNGFKLISLKLKNDKIFGDIEYNFIDSDDKQDEIYTTVIIGSNGTRKSLLFKRLILLFWDLRNLREDKKNRKYDYWFSLKYSLSDLHYNYSNIHKFGENGYIQGDCYLAIDGIIQKDGNKKHSFDNAYIPDSIIAITAIMPDKFPFPDPDFYQYKYIGHRYRPQLAGTSTYINRTVNYIANSVDNDGFINAINNLLKDFFNPEYDPYFTFFTQNTTLFFNNELTSTSFAKFYEKIDEKYSGSGKIPPFKLNYFKKFVEGNEELIRNLVSICKKLKSDERLRKLPRSSKKALSYKINDDNDLEKLKVEVEALNHLKSLGILSSPILEFLKLNQSEFTGYSVLDSSSGEHNIFGAMIGLMATIKPESLILIDEPEISLHPNWQMKYLNSIRTLFINSIYAKSHILIATHSHFFISDTKGTNSKIIGLTRDPKLQIVHLPKNINTFGWSAEEVLLKVFNVPTSRNYFVAEKLGLLLDFIASEHSTNETIKLKFYELELDKVNGLTEEDPLKTAYDTIVKEYVS